MEGSTFKEIAIKEVKIWYKAAKTSDFPENSGACILYNGKQIAVYNFTMRNEWYATQNMCPHKYEMALSRGIIGDSSNEPKVACPFHKKTFSLKSGACMSGDPYEIETYPVKIEDGYVFIGITDELME
jgi:nitrite reductase (NADH) small subunit